LPPLTRGSAAWGDIDSDGNLDLLTSGFTGLPFLANSGRSDLWHNDGGILNPNPIFTFGDGGAGSVCIVDADCDGDPDLAICGGTNFTRLFWQTSPNVFSEAPANWFAGVSRAAMAWGDRDGDGDPDIALGGNTANQLISDSRTWFYNNQKNSVTGSTLLTTGLRDGTAEWIDVDNDGDNDLFITGSTTWYPSAAQTLLFINDNGLLTPVPTGLPNVSDSAAAFADFNLDGYPDLALSGRDSGTALFTNNGAGQFFPYNTNLPPYAFGSLAWGDFDNDGYPDLLISGIGPQDARTELWFNDHGNLFPTGNSFAGKSARGVAWGDCDGDGHLDLALIGSPDDGSSPPRIPYFSGVFKNNLTTPATLPPTPTGLNASLNSGVVTLAWQMPSNAPKGMSYNVRVGTTPFANNIMSALADPVTGHLRVPLRGNAGWSGLWRLRNLADGTYYWSVQAINPAFQGSAFALESSFSIPAVTVVTPRFTQISRPSVGQLRLDATGHPNRYVFLETSSDLVSWMQAQMVQFNGSGMLTWTGPIVPGKAFFRLRQP
jgi:hypothetical protein